MTGDFFKKSLLFDRKIVYYLVNKYKKKEDMMKTKKTKQCFFVRMGKVLYGRSTIPRPLRGLVVGLIVLVCIVGFVMNPFPFHPRS
jgi:uncharacterized membrane protein YbaN (DUF454 family)